MKDDSDSNDESVSTEGGCPAGGAIAEAGSLLSQGLPGEPSAGSGHNSELRKAGVRRPGYHFRQGTLLDAHPKTMRRQGMVCKPWKGPLPPVDCARSWKLEDIRVLGCRAGKKGSAVNFADYVSSVDSPVVNQRSPASEKKGCSGFDPDLKFEIRSLVALKWTGPDRAVQNGPFETQKSFRFSSGLGLLFRRGGKPIGIPTGSHSHLRRAESESKREAAMAMWQREGWRGGGDREERRDGAYQHEKRFWPRYGEDRRAGPGHIVARGRGAFPGSRWKRARQK
jgi:hypothetical protein